MQNILTDIWNKNSPYNYANRIVVGADSLLLKIYLTCQNPTFFITLVSVLLAI